MASSRGRLHSRAQLQQQQATPNPSTGPSSRRTTTTTSTSTTPSTSVKYQPPAHFPLQPKEKRLLEGLSATLNSENGAARRYIAEALRVLSDAAGDLAELVPTVDFAVKDEEGGGEEGKGKRLLVQMEGRAREMVDRGWEAEVQGRVLREGGVVDLALGQAAEGEEDGDEDEEGGKAGMWQVFEGEMEDLKVERAGKSMRERYAAVNEYKDFRRSIWEIQHAGEPMPPTKHWFPHDPLLQPRAPAPAPPTSTAATATAPSPSPGTTTPDPDSDSDLEIGPTRQSYNCPITLRPFLAPVTSTLCPHSFEKAAITSMLSAATTTRPLDSDERPERGVGPTAGVGREKCIHCPAAGCERWLAGRNLREDRVLVRRIRMERERREREEVLRGEGGSAGGQGGEGGQGGFMAVGEESVVWEGKGEPGGLGGEGGGVGVVKGEKGEKRIKRLDEDGDEDEDM